MTHHRPDDEAWYCGQCGFEGKPVPIVYGYPTSEASEAAVAGEIRLGGCVVTGDDPEIACANCGAALDDYPQLPLVTPADRLAGGVWGHLVGDAVGVPYEFGPPIDPSGVRFGATGAHDQPSGTWSDDGALMLALLDSLLTRGFDTTDQAQRIVAWYREGKYAVGGAAFDVGIATSAAISRIEEGVPAEEAGPSDEMSCGNGSLMRILPVALVHRFVPASQLVDEAHRASKVTHGHHRPQVACALYVLIARQLLRSDDADWALHVAKLELRDIYSSPDSRPATWRLSSTSSHGPSGRGEGVSGTASGRPGMRSKGPIHTRTRSSARSPTAMTRTPRPQSVVGWPGSVGASVASRRSGWTACATRSWRVSWSRV